MKSRVELSTINNLVKSASYAVRLNLHLSKLLADFTLRGAIVSRSMELSAQLSKNPASLPFKKIISCNIGNPHALNQPALSFHRDVLSIVLNPSLSVRCQFPEDVLTRSLKYINSMPDIGAYSESQGIPVVRQEVCEFLEERDGFKADPADIFLTNGASEGVRLCMQTIIRPPVTPTSPKDGILTPIPQYPLTTLLQGELVPYYLNESHGWGCSTDSLSASLKSARERGVNVRGLVVINPGNPTGQILGERDMRYIVDWCKGEGVLLCADEVYQENIWSRKNEHRNGFVSFRKVAHEAKAWEGPEDQRLQLISFHSVSKGFLGECGLRGGYFEMLGIPADVKQEIYKLASISLCSNTIGQLTTGLMVRPPREGEASYSRYISERDEILTSLARRARVVTEGLNKLPGVKCNPIEGAMYAFPTISLPAKAISAAKAQGLEADAMYCMSLLEETGIVVVPGSGFGQESGTYHFRTTILPPEESMEEVMSLLSSFHHKFLAKYA